MPEIVDGSMPGLDRLVGEIRESSRKLGRTRKVSSDEGRDLLREAARRAPVETGQLRGAHRVRVSENGARVDAPTEYTARQHFRQQTGRAREWMYGALDSQRDDIVDGHIEHARDSVDNIGGRYV